MPNFLFFTDEKFAHRLNGAAEAELPGFPKTGRYRELQGKIKKLNPGVSDFKDLVSVLGK